MGEIFHKETLPNKSLLISISRAHVERVSVRVCPLYMCKYLCLSGAWMPVLPLSNFLGSSNDVSVIAGNLCLILGSSETCVFAFL